ncbi:hypothetical protein [Archangium lipolyticum]|uniref:hypothetical protein n=1 Tax=Archangium lipolyticum TaxID=2970465 RepID=UPI002149D9E5|nr:hypothetical protein [Archangium lipolyticum]
MRNPRTVAGAAVLALLVAVSLVLLGREGAHEEAPAVAGPAPSVPAPRAVSAVATASQDASPTLPATGAPQQVLQDMEENVRVMAQERLSSMEPARPAENVGRFKRENVEQVRDAFREMLAYQGLFNSRRERKRLAAEVLDNPEGRDIAAQTLSDPAFAKQAFGEFQAEARYFAVEVVREATRRGDDALALSVVSGLTSELAAARGELDRGRTQDLQDLLRTFAEVKGPGAFQSRQQLAEQLGYSRNLPFEIRKIYIDSLVSGFWVTTDIEEAKRVAMLAVGG